MTDFKCPYNACSCKSKCDECAIERGDWAPINDDISSEQRSNLLEHAADMDATGYRKDAAVLRKLLRSKVVDKQGWIAAKDQKPEKFTDVIVWPRPTEVTMEAQWTGYAWTYSEYEHNWGWATRECDVTHWMPLPAAPSAGNAEEA